MDIVERVRREGINNRLTWDTVSEIQSLRAQVERLTADNNALMLSQTLLNAAIEDRDRRIERAIKHAGALSHTTEILRGEA